jgi:LMBR1 domain-containing protein 1
MIALAWIIFAAVVVGVLLLNFIIVKYFNSRYDSETFPTIVSIFALTLTLLCVMIIPVDIYAVSLKNEDINSVISVLYYIFYAGILATCFVIIPFVYFFYEAYDPEGTTGKRIVDGCKYTVALLVVVVVLFVVGLFLKPGEKPTGGDPFWVWANKLLDTENSGAGAITFAIACLSLIGLVSWCFYTAFGLSFFPIGMIRGRRRLMDEKRRYDEEAEDAREKVKFIDDKKKKSRRDQQDREKLLRRERALSRRADRVEESGCCYKCLQCLRPLTFIFGIIFLLFTLLIVVSTVLTSLDKILNSFCGAKCGFILSHPQIFNPLDELLVILSKYFPVDYVLMALIILYIYFATLSGITNMGIRFLWIKMFTFKKRATPPQGLLLASVILMLSILVLNLQVLTLAPRYTTFGSQTFQWQNMTEPALCNFDSIEDTDCAPTQLSTIWSRLGLKISFFGVVFYWSNWAFVAFFLVGLLVAACRNRKSNIDEYSDDEDEPEGLSPDM